MATYWSAVVGDTIVDSYTHCAMIGGQTKTPTMSVLFERKVAPDDIAAYVHSGGTTGSPKLVKLTHRGFSYKFWANTLVMAHTADDVIFSLAALS